MTTQPKTTRSPEDLLTAVFPLVEALRKMLARVELLWVDQGIAPSEAAALERLFIDHDGRARSGDLLGHPIRSTPALGKVLASLEAKGLITRKRDTDDGRVVIVTATDGARELYNATIEQILSVVVAPTTASLDPQEFAALRTITKKLHPPDPGRT